MIIFINGAFGIGKSTVARHLRTRLVGSGIFDAEPLGVFLQHVAQWFPLNGAGTGDFQDLSAWRQWCVRGIRSMRLVRGTVIVPMAFSNLGYLREFLEGVRPADPHVFVICLVAPMKVVHQRLAGRAGEDGTIVNAWAVRRAAECCEAHQSPAFGLPVKAGCRSPDSLAAEIAALVDDPNVSRLRKTRIG